MYLYIYICREHYNGIEINRDLIINTREIKTLYTYTINALNLCSECSLN